MKKIEIYTDGACKGNPGPGGWGVLLRSESCERELYGCDISTTNNRMEMTAVIEALQIFQTPCKITLHLDSQYVHKGVTQWLQQWKANNWKTANKKKIKNLDLWQKLDSLITHTAHHITFHWVKGHSGNDGNERADYLANLGVKNLINQKINN